MAPALLFDQVHSCVVTNNFKLLNPTPLSDSGSKMMFPKQLGVFLSRYETHLYHLLYNLVRVNNNKCDNEVKKIWEPSVCAAAPSIRGARFHGLSSFTLLRCNKMFDSFDLSIWIPNPNEFLSAQETLGETRNPTLLSAAGSFH